jgi:hypothetical protein
MTNSLMAVAAILLIFTCGGIVIATALHRTFFAAPTDAIEPALDIAPAK